VTMTPIMLYLPGFGKKAHESYTAVFSRQPACVRECVRASDEVLSEAGSLTALGVEP
jgi:hypothetical protein